MFNQLFRWQYAVCLEFCGSIDREGLLLLINGETESMLNDHVNSILLLLQKSKLLMHVLKIIITKVTIQFYGSPIFFPALCSTMLLWACQPWSFHWRGILTSCRRRGHMSQRCQPEKCRPFCGRCDGNVIEALPLWCTVLESQTMTMTWTSFVPPLTSYLSELAKVRGAGGESGPTMKLRWENL